MKLQSRNEQGKLITYEQRGVKFVVLNNGDKHPIVDYPENWKQQQILESFRQSQYFMCPDEYKNVYYLKRTEGKVKRFYIDEEFDGLAVTIFNGLSSKRYSVETVVYNSESKLINVYYTEEFITLNQELNEKIHRGYEIHCKKFGKMTDNKILDKVIDDFSNRFIEKKEDFNLMEILK